jgi:HSP20 family protein
MSALVRWQPFRELTSLQEHINQLFTDVFPDMSLLEPSSTIGSSFAPRTDVYEENDRIVLEMETPGLREEDLTQ